MCRDGYMYTGRSSFSLQNVFWNSKGRVCHLLYTLTQLMSPITVKCASGEYVSSARCSLLPHITNLTLYFCTFLISSPLRPNAYFVCSTFLRIGLRISFRQLIFSVVLNTFSAACTQTILNLLLSASLVVYSSSFRPFWGLRIVNLFGAYISWG